MRTHVVLVPGFGGFDALGQLRYYVGVTKAFEDWRNDPRSAHGGNAALHYFDNLPTASVKTRAKLLRRYVHKLVERNIIGAGDALVLGGHSTGGLDIRQLVVDLDADADREILPRLKRIVFLSVPHRGTHLASWAKKHMWSRKLAVRSFRRFVEKDTHVPGWLWRLADRIVPGSSALFDAVADIHADFEPPSTDPLDRADARAARAEVKLWLEHTDHDFLAIDDLAAGRDVTLDAERARWKALGIETQSYATLGRCPFEPDQLRHLQGLRSWRTVWQAVRADRPDTDVVYRLGYAACAGGASGRAPHAAHWLAGWGPAGERRTLETWENDGVVNTVSMVLPDEPVWLVPGDHADIIGHYAPRSNCGAVAGSRRNEAYDLLESGSAFTKRTFDAVWFDVFDFAVPKPASKIDHLPASRSVTG